jgi:RNA polymerase sigma-70 factor (ECF subfamily)
MRTVVALALVEGFSYAEIAQITDAPIGTVMSRLARGRAKLRQALHPYSSTKDSSGAHGHCGRNGMAM